jgi:pimeloyl-ACP methyl ester carboxylesterase
MMTNPIRVMVVLAACALMWSPHVVSAQDSRPLQRIAVNGGELEYDVHGTGDPVLLIHGTGVAATFAPTMTQPSLAGYRLIRFHRRGFAGSSRAPVPFSMTEQAADAAALLKALGIARAHIVGHSFGGMVALQLALDQPAMVRSLVVMEPPIFNPDAAVSPFAALEKTYASGDKLGAMATFSQMSYGAEWRTLAARVPGGSAQVEKDVDTVFQSEAPSAQRRRRGSRSRSSTSPAVAAMAARSSN